MTVAALEGVSTAGGGAAAAGRSRARQRRPTDAEMGRSGRAGSSGRPGPEGSAGRTGPRGATGATAPSKPRSAAAGERRERPERSRSRRREAARRVTGAATRPEPALHNYQAIIAAEFVGAALLAAMGPFSSRAPGPTSQSPTSMSPYGVLDLVKIFAIGIVYMILEFMAAGPRGLARFSAWFGALIFLGVGLSELSRIAQIFKTISGGNVNPTKLTAAQAPAQKNAPPIGALGQPGGTPPPAAAEGGGGPPFPPSPQPDIGDLFPKIGPSASTFVGGT